MTAKFTIEEIQAKLHGLAGVAPPPVKTKATMDIYLMSYDQIKALEQKAQEWLLSHKNLETEDPVKWNEAKSRYNLIVRAYNMKHDSYLRELERAASKPSPSALSGVEDRVADRS